MAMTNTIVGRDVWGSKCMTYGAFTNDSTSGNINTGLGICEQLLIQPNNNVSPAVQCNLTTVLPAAGSAIGVATTIGVDGYWMGIGDRFI